jgi:ribonuclease Z
MSTPLAELEHAGIRLQGFSRAGEETFIAMPEMNLAFDVGRAPREVIALDHVFLSHGHMDHAAGVAYYLAQRMFVDAPPGNIYLPLPLVEPLRRLLRVWGDIDGHEPPGNIVAAVPGSDIPLRRDLLVRPFAVNHPCRRHDRTVVSALGYAAIEVRNKLKESYQGLEGPELVQLKKRGVEITQRVEIPLVTYCGDTAPGPFLELDWVRNARVLLLECTFTHPEHRERARAGFHFHLEDLRQALPRLCNEKIVLTHLSRRTALPEARGHVRQALGSEADERVVFLMDLRPRRSVRKPDRSASR